MNQRDVADFCERYMLATGSLIAEKSPAHMKVKLSPEADKDLTGRHYYWGFVERTGAEPETMSFVFVFDQEAHEAAKPTEKKPSPSPASAAAPVPDAGDSILGRYFGIAPAAPPGRLPEEQLAFGHKRLEQMIASAHARGSYLQLFELPPPAAPGALGASAYATWLGVNYKVSFTCDMKREELYSLGIHMRTGEIVERFHERVSGRLLVPHLPANTLVRETITLERAVADLEGYIERKLSVGDYRWAEDALGRLAAEQARVDEYFGERLKTAAEDSEREQLEATAARQKEELERQYYPYVEVAPINCGWFHLLSDSLADVNSPSSPPFSKRTGK